jgi:hypothetical protein
MRSARYGFHDGVVGGVSDWCFCEDLDQGVECREVYVPSSVVSVQVVQFAPGLFFILLRVWPDSLRDSVPLRWGLVWRDVLDCSF